jgi:hypothetical protein
MIRDTEYLVYALRYYPSIVTGEFLNVGVALVCPQTQWWDVRVPLAIRGFRRVFSTAQPDSLRIALRRIEQAVKAHRMQQANYSSLIVERWETPMQAVVSAVGQLWGSLRWSSDPVRGVTSDPAVELDYWFSQLVHIAQDELEVPNAHGSRRRVDALLHAELEQRGILPQLRPAEVGTYVKERFDYTFTNGRLNVFESIRLKYADPLHVRARAQQWRGRLDTLNDGLEDRFNFFALVDLPESGPQRDEAEIGVEMIRRANANRVETFTLEEVDDLGARAQEIVAHTE